MFPRPACLRTAPAMAEMGQESVHLLSGRLGVRASTSPVTRLGGSWNSLDKPPPAPRTPSRPPMGCPAETKSHPPGNWFFSSALNHADASLSSTPGLHAALGWAKLQVWPGHRMARPREFRAAFCHIQDPAEEPPLLLQVRPIMH